MNPAVWQALDEAIEKFEAEAEAQMLALPPETRIAIVQFATFAAEAVEKAKAALEDHDDDQTAARGSAEPHAYLENRIRRIETVADRLKIEASDTWRFACGVTEPDYATRGMFFARIGTLRVFKFSIEEAIRALEAELLEMVDRRLESLAMLQELRAKMAEEPSFIDGSGV